MPALVVAANLLCPSQLVKPQVIVTLNPVSKDGTVTVQKGKHFPPESTHSVLTQIPAQLLWAWLPAAQEGPFVIYVQAHRPYFLGTVM